MYYRNQKVRKRMKLFSETIRLWDYHWTKIQCTSLLTFQTKIPMCSCIGQVFYISVFYRQKYDNFYFHYGGQKYVVFRICCYPHSSFELHPHHFHPPTSMCARFALTLVSSQSSNSSALLWALLTLSDPWVSSVMQRISCTRQVF